MTGFVEHSFKLSTVFGLLSTVEIIFSQTLKIPIILFIIRVHHQIISFPALFYMNNIFIFLSVIARIFYWQYMRYL